MKKNRKIPDNELSTDIYVTTKKTKFKIVLIAFILLFLGFFFNFPIKDVIKSQTISAIDSIRDCNIGYDDLDVSTFIVPKVVLKNTVISGRCLGRGSNKINLGNVVLKVAGPSFYPPGIRLHLSAKKDDTEIHAYPSLSFVKHIVKIQDTYISSSLLDGMSGANQFFSGRIFVEAKIELERNSIAAAKLLIKSNNLVIPPQNLGGGMFQLPELRIGSVTFKASVLKENLSIQEFVFGNETSPLVGNVKGKIRLNRFNFMNSKPDLRGEVKFSPEFNQKFGGMLKFAIRDAVPRNGFYQFRLQSFNPPMPKFY